MWKRMRGAARFDGGTRLAAAAASLVLAVFAAGGTAWAAGSDLDPGFEQSTDEPGQWRDSFPTDECPGLDHAHGLAVQSSDGKVVVAGYGARDVTAPCDDPPFNHFVVARVTTTGTLDDTFGDSATVNRTGFTTTDVVPGGYEARADAVAVQPDGKIVVAGQTGAPSSTSTPVYRFGLARYDTNGELDTSFGTACSGGETPGTTSTIFPGDFDYAHAVALQADGKIVAAGATLTSTGNYDFAIARYLADGCPDNTFDGDGRLVHGFPGNGNDLARAVVIQPSGKIVVAGSSSGKFGLARFNAEDGSLDAGFGTGGETTTDVGPGGSINALVRAPDGKLVAGGNGYAGATTATDFALARYSADGVPDGSFDTDGKVTTSFGTGASNTDVAQRIGIQPDGMIVAGGYTCCDASGRFDFALARYTAAGALDPTFDADGRLQRNIDSGHDQITALTIPPSGKILTAGWDTILSGTENEFVVNRYLGSSESTTDDPGTTTPGSGQPVGAAPGPGPGPGPGGGIQGDTVAPAFVTATLTNRTFAVDPDGAGETAVAARAKKGTTFVYNLSEPSRVLFTIDRKAKGRKQGRRCRRPSRKNRHRKRCTRYVRAGRFAQDGVAGVNTKHFSGRIGRRALKPGKYRASLLATDASGNKSALKRLSFKVVRR